MLEEPIQEAYLRAIYRATHGGQAFAFSFRGRPGECPLPLGLTGKWAIITAHNPMSVRLDVQANGRRAAALVEFLNEHRLVSEPAENSAPDGSWREPGRIVFGLTREVALEVGRRFGQRSIVWGEGGEAGVLDCRTERWIRGPCYPVGPIAAGDSTNPTGD